MFFPFVRIDQCPSIKITLITYTYTLHTLQVDEIAFINSLQADLAAFGFETKLKKGEARRLRHQQERATQPLLQPVRGLGLGWSDWLAIGRLLLLLLLVF
jgi:hypothetical protein